MVSDEYWKNWFLDDYKAYSGEEANCLTKILFYVKSDIK